jgi:hypothetical protein
VEARLRDHTLVDVMVVDAIHRLSMGRSWITVAFDIATRSVLGGSVAMDCRIFGQRILKSTSAAFNRRAKSSAA